MRFYLCNHVCETDSYINNRLVCLSPADEDEVDASKPCQVSQLALVDLAGSERTSRTGNTGDRLREAGEDLLSCDALHSF